MKMQGIADDRVQLTVGSKHAVVSIEGKRVARLPVVRQETLTRRDAETIAEAWWQGSPERAIVVFARSSPDARAILREHGISYVAPDGELFVLAPPVYVERPGRRRAAAATAAPSPPALTAPFAARASRVPRHLLLHADQRPTFRELADQLELSEAMVSRTVRALADDGLVAIKIDPDDARRRRARLRDPGALLDAFERAGAGRRRRALTWDVGGSDVPTALQRLREAAVRSDRPYAVGGVAGAAFVRRVVEPADVVVWVARDDVDAWAEASMAVPARSAPGRLTVRVAPDPFALTLATAHDGVLVADPVQLYLDCRLEGERALEAAEAIRAEMSW